MVRYQNCVPSGLRGHRSVTTSVLQRHAAPNCSFVKPVICFGELAFSSGFSAYLAIIEI